MTELLVEKQFDSTLSIPESIPPEVMEQINRHAGEAIPADEVFVRTAHLANDQYDRSFERFPVEYLQRFAETMPGKSLLAGHDRNEVPLGIWLKGDVYEAPDGVRHLRLPFYMDRKTPEARKVRLGIAKQVSIQFRAAGRTCDLCGADYDGANGCENGHRKGQAYDGKLCRVTYSGDLSRVEGMEGSLVWLACQYGAQVTAAKQADPWGGYVLSVSKSEGSNMPDELIELRAKVAELEDTNKALSPLAEDGKAYRKFLIEEIATKVSALHVDQPEVAKAKAELQVRLLADRDTAFLQDYLKSAQADFDAKFPPPTQSLPLGDGPGHSVPAPPEGGPPPPQKFDPRASLRG